MSVRNTQTNPNDAPSEGSNNLPSAYGNFPQLNGSGSTPQPHPEDTIKQHKELSKEYKTMAIATGILAAAAAATAVIAFSLSFGAATPIVIAGISLSKLLLIITGSVSAGAALASGITSGVLTSRASSIEKILDFVGPSKNPFKDLFQILVQNYKPAIESIDNDQEGNHDETNIASEFEKVADEIFSNINNNASKDENAETKETTEPVSPKSIGEVNTEEATEAIKAAAQDIARNISQGYKQSLCTLGRNISLLQARDLSISQIIEDQNKAISGLSQMTPNDIQKGIFQEAEKTKEKANKKAEKANKEAEKVHQDPKKAYQVLQEAKATENFQGTLLQLQLQEQKQLQEQLQELKQECEAYKKYAICCGIFYTISKYVGTEVPLDILEKYENQLSKLPYDEKVQENVIGAILEAVLKNRLEIRRMSQSAEQEDSQGDIPQAEPTSQDIQDIVGEFLREIKGKLSYKIQKYSQGINSEINDSNDEFGLNFFNQQ